MPPQGHHVDSFGRRRFVQGGAATATLGMLPRSLFAQTPGPWATRPPGNPQQVTFVVWQYGNIYDQIGKQFEQDWSVKVQQIIEPNVEPQVAKLTAMYAAGDPVDVSQSPIQYLSSYISQGIAEPIDGLPGVDQYVKDFTPFTRAIAQRDGKTWGLPYFSTVWVFIYNDELLAKAGFKGKPFSSYPELIEQAKKAKRDGVCKYPILWVAGVGFEQLPATWFSMTHNRGGAIFDKQLNPQLGAGSVARETLKWWQNTFKEELADPNSLNLRFIPAVKAFNAGQHIYLGTLHHYYVSLVNDRGAVAHRGQGPHRRASRRREDDRLHHAVHDGEHDQEQGVGLEAAPVPGRAHEGRTVHAGQPPRHGRDAGQRVSVRDGFGAPEEGLGEVGGRADRARHLEQGDQLRRRRAGGAAAVVSALERRDERRADRVPVRQDHRGSGVRQHGRGDREGQAGLRARPLGRAFVGVSGRVPPDPREGRGAGGPPAGHAALRCAPALDGATSAVTFAFGFPQKPRSRGEDPRPPAPPFALRRPARETPISEVCRGRSCGLGPLLFG